MYKRSKLNIAIMLFTLVAILLTACSSNAEPALPTPTRLPLSAAEQEKAGYIDQHYTQLAQEGKFSGSVLVEMDGKIIIDQGYGYADRVDEIPNTIQTRFRLFNATKVFTAIGILMLTEQNKLDLADPICNYFDDCPSSWSGLTVENLLTHSSGFHDYTLVTPIKQTWDQPISREDLYAILKDVSMDTQINPNNWGGATDYALLGLIIETVSGQAYADFFGEQVIQPLGLANTGFVQGTGDEDNLAVFYKGEEIEPAMLIDMSNLVGYANAYSSAEDLLLLVNAIRDEKLLSTDSIAIMLIPNNFGIGYGWQLYEFDEKTWVTNYVGFFSMMSKHTVLAWTEDGSIVTVVLSNQEDGFTDVHPKVIACLPGQPTSGQAHEQWQIFAFCKSQ